MQVMTLPMYRPDCQVVDVLAFMKIWFEFTVIFSLIILFKAIWFIFIDIQTVNCWMLRIGLDLFRLLKLNILVSTIVVEKTLLILYASIWIVWNEVVELIYFYLTLRS